MKKLKLEDIRVESYETQAEPSSRGTVKGNEETEQCESATPMSYCPWTCYSWCYTLCNTDCGFSCFTDYYICCGAPA